MKIKKTLYCVFVIITTILLTGTVHASGKAAPAPEPGLLLLLGLGLMGIAFYRRHKHK
jgi:hypothetical protein